MAFPETVLPIKVEFAPAGTWIDITEYVYLDDIVINRGSADETRTSQPTRCTFRLNNIDGRFSPRNPNGPYFGQIGRNTPILVSVMDGDRYLDIPGDDSGHASTPDNAQTSITGDIDVRFDATIKDWSGKDGNTALIGKYLVTGNQRGWRLEVITGGTLLWRWSVDGVANITASSTVPMVPDPGGRLAVRATHDVDNGAAGNTVTFYTAPTIDGPWEQLGDPVVTAGTTSIFDNTAATQIGDALSFGDPYGKIWAGKVFNGINGTAAVDVDFRIQTVGDTSFVDDAGLTWTTAASGGGSISNQHNRFRGEAVAWPARWTTGGFDSWVPMVAESLVRRLNQGTDPLQSALRRRIPSDSDLLAYWPMEDLEAATRFASALPAGTAMTYTGDVDPAAHAGPDGSSDLPSFNENCSWFAPVAGPAVAANAWHCEWIVNLQQVTATERTLQQFQATGTVLNWRLLVATTGVRVLATARDGTVVINNLVSFTINDYLNIWVRWELKAEQNGGNVDWVIRLIPISGTGQAVSASFAGTVGRITAVSGPPNLNTDISGLSWGHLGVFNVFDTSIFNGADQGFAGDTAWERLDRLTTEEGVPINLLGASSLTASMGAQRPDKLIDLLQEAADADRGILGDTRDEADFTAFRFVGRQCLYNQPVRLTLGYEDDGEMHAPLDPTDDDQYTRNRVTAQRKRGSQATVEVAEGALGTDTIGPYPTEVEVNIESDDRLVDYAGWEAHLGTWDEERFPTVIVKVHAAPGLTNEVLAIDQGSRIRLTDCRDETIRTWIAPGDIDLMVRGYEERLSQFNWEIEYQCVPATPYDVNSIDHLGQQTQRIDTDGTEVAEALDTTETAVEVFTTSGPTWTDDVENMPFDWMIGGEAMTVLAPGATVNSNSLFDANVTGWTAQACTLTHSTAFVHPDPRAAGSVLVTPDGTLGSANCLSATALTVNTGGVYRVAAWFYSPGGYDSLRVRMNWHDSGNIYLSTSSGSATAVAAGVWTYIEADVTAPASAAFGYPTTSADNSPTAGEVYYAWAVRGVHRKASLVYDLFGRTATDTWGSADSMQAWTNTGGAAADYDVLTGFGRHINPAVSVSHYSTITNTEPDADVYADMTTAATPTGGSLFTSLQARHTNTSNWYEVRLTYSTANVITLTLRKFVAGVATDLDTFTHWITHAAGTFMRVRLQVIGTSLKAKAWRVGDPEPDVWQVEATDSDLSAAGSVGVRSVRDAANTNANAELRFDNFELANPQVYSVVRSADGVVKSHSSGAAVVLRYPMTLAL